MDRFSELPNELQYEIYGHRLQKSLKKKYHDIIKCSPNTSISLLKKSDLIDCIINRYFFVSLQYLILAGRTRYKYVINGFVFLNMLFNIFEFTLLNQLDSDRTLKKIKIDNLVTIINKCTKTFKLNITDNKELKKENKFIDIFNYLLDNISDNKNDYKNLNKDNVYVILDILNKDILTLLYKTINILFTEKEFEW